MEKKHKIIIGVLVGLVVSFLLYLKLSKDSAIKTLMKFIPTADKEVLKSMDRGYLMNRAKAFKDGATDFYFKNKLFDTKTGRVKSNADTSTGVVIKKSEVDMEVKKPFDIFDYETWF